LPSSTDVWDEILDAAADESSLWREVRRTDAERTAVFSTLADARFALGLETIYEGYLCHYARPRLFTPADDETALLLGDYLYAHGLVRIAETGSVGAVQQLSKLISLCARLRAEDEEGDGEAWAATSAALASQPPGDAAVERALASHRKRLR
jgi:hypothetical protein